MLLAVAAVAALAETAVAAEIQSPAMDMGLVRKAMALRVKYRVSEKASNIAVSIWVCTHRTAEGCTRIQTLFATWA